MTEDNLRTKKPKKVNPKTITAKKIREEQREAMEKGELPYEPPFVPNPYGRTPKELNHALIKQLCAMQATDGEIAACCGVSSDTIARRRQSDPEFAQMMLEARMSGKASVRRTLYMQAVSGQNPAFTMFWAKNHLGLSDKPEDEGPLPLDKARRIKEALDAMDGAVTATKESE